MLVPANTRYHSLLASGSKFTSFYADQLLKLKTSSSSVRGLFWNIRSPTPTKIQYIKSVLTLNNINYDFIALTEVRCREQLKPFEMSHQIIFNEPSSLTNGVALLLKPSLLQVCDPFLSIEGTVIATAAKYGVPFILIVTYLHASVNKSEQLKFILSNIQNISLPFLSPKFFGLRTSILTQQKRSK